VKLLFQFLFGGSASSVCEHFLTAQHLFWKNNFFYTFFIGQHHQDEKIFFEPPVIALTEQGNFSNGFFWRKLDR